LIELVVTVVVAIRSDSTREARHSVTSSGLPVASHGPRGMDTQDTRWTDAGLRTALRYDRSNVRLWRTFFAAKVR